MAKRGGPDLGTLLGIGLGGFLLYNLFGKGKPAAELTPADLSPEAQVQQASLKDGGNIYRQWYSRVMQLYQAFSAGAIDGDRAKALDQEYKDGISRDFMSGLLTVNDKMTLLRYMPLNT